MKKFSAILAMLTLASCSSSEPRSIQWFKDHDVERKAVIEACNQNSVPESVECMNAQKAADALALERRGYVKPQPLKFDSGD